MPPNDTLPTPCTPWQLARRAERMNPSIIREILKITERPGIISLAGGLPSAGHLSRSRPCATPAERVLRDAPREALQYAASEGYGRCATGSRRGWARRAWRCDAEQVLITTGSQQGLDLVGKVLIDAGSRVAVETPTYLGALQAFAPYEPEFMSVDCDDEGPVAASAGRCGAVRASCTCCPTSRTRAAAAWAPRGASRWCSARARAGLPLVEDNPYGDLWYDAPPPPPLQRAGRRRRLYLGSFSKVLSPGLRLGYLVAPPALYPKLLQAKQAADLHTPGFNQRVVHEVIRNGLLDAHVPTIRARYKAQRDAMDAALDQHLPAGCRWQRAGRRHVLLGRTAVHAGRDGAAAPGGGSRHGLRARRALLLPAPRRNTLRLSFVTVAPPQIEQAWPRWPRAARGLEARP